MQNYESKAGFISEMELDELVSNKTVGGATTVPCAIAIIGITLSAGICPTSACSKDCPWNN
ncbi:class II lanthipeptide, LchA2/BrtA2 family [Clostridium cellulovorans]|uniref:Uncharacterized protein n=1 Tax=Clostridium cellulovorans (strain ATCC 35296 / DSM 3052 / OCM 3 / 743B) TaxID=573061 RepID=D9SN95_CLOC7|nr:class II lanthipeptide, LchA2/BrtA2 family [Clostridium cellulovorans]ADL53887.1 hypothetical protein Clocel_4226 [Clostridium cellulovorans 743B]